MAIKKKVARKSASSPSSKVKPAPKKAGKASGKSAPESTKAKNKPVKKSGPVVVKKVVSKQSVEAKSAPNKAKQSMPTAKKNEENIKTPAIKKIAGAAAPKKSAAKKEATIKSAVHQEPAAEMVQPTTAKVAPVVAKAPLKPKEPDNRLRYDDKELAEFKELIQEKLESTRSELKYYQEQIKRSNDNSTDDTENRFNTEDGIGAMEREHYMQMASRLYQYIDHLEKALIRIENKTYGICRVTGRLIDKDRLRAVPHATLSLEAKLTQKKETVHPAASAIPAIERPIDEGERTTEE